MSSSCLSRDPLHLLMGGRLKASRDCLVGDSQQFHPFGLSCTNSALLEIDGGIAVVAFQL